MKVADSSSSHKLQPPIQKNGGQSQGNQRGSGFALGEILKARVLKVWPDGTAILESNGRTLTAKSLVNLVPGTEMWLEVKELGTSPLLSLAGKKGAAHDFIKAFFLTLSSREAPLPQLLTQFSFMPHEQFAEENAALGELYLQLLSGVATEKPDPELLRLMAFIFGSVRNAGGEGESSVSALFNKVKENISDGKYHEQKQFQRALEGGVKTIEMHQQLNATASSPNETMFFLFPCFFGGDESWGEWFFSMNEEEDREGFSLEFFLDMSRLGPLSFHLQSHGSELRGEFLVSQGGARNHIAKQLPELTDILASLGYHPVSLVCNKSDHSTPEEIQKKIASLAGLHRFALIDLEA